MGILHEILKGLKPQQGYRYRLVRLEDANVTRKKQYGYHFVRGEDPECKGTDLATDHKDAEGLIRVGGLALARIREVDAQKREKALEDRKKRIEAAIKRKYLEAGENLKREMGKDHKYLKVFHGEDKV